jgi:hypothetical protein
MTTQGKECAARGRKKKRSEKHSSIHGIIKHIIGVVPRHGGERSSSKPHLERRCRSSSRTPLERRRSCALTVDLTKVIRAKAAATWDGNGAAAAAAAAAARGNSLDIADDLAGMLIDLENGTAAILLLQIGEDGVTAFGIGAQQELDQTLGLDRILVLSAARFQKRGHNLMFGSALMRIAALQLLLRGSETQLAAETTTTLCEEMTAHHFTSSGMRRHEQGGRQNTVILGAETTTGDT